MFYDITDYLKHLVDPQYSKLAIKLALCIGTLYFMINHGSALLAGTMTKQRWVSGLLTYAVPYCVNIHGQWISSKQKTKKEKWYSH